MVYMLLFWFVAGWLIARWTDRRATTGLTLAYFLGLVLIHWFGALIYLFPAMEFQNPIPTRIGFEIATYGVVGLTIGVGLVRFLLPRKAIKTAEEDTFHVDEPLALIFFGLGLFVLLILQPLVGQVATVTAILSGLTQLTTVGICLGLWLAIKKRNQRKLLLWLLAAVLMPFITLLTTAFVGYGMNTLIAITAFLVAMHRVKAIHIPLVIVGAYLGMSLYVTYFEDRPDYRKQVWGEQIGLSERLSAVGAMITDFEFVDGDNTSHLYAIDIRLNQNNLVGLAANNVRRGARELGHGESIVFSFIALVPRAIWPGKPTVGGGGDIVSRYTGLHFERHTSVGAGQVLEFYVNFAEAGVVLGFLVFGAILAFIDRRAAYHLWGERLGLFILWFLPGLGFLQAGGNFVEITTTSVSSIVSALLVMQIANRSRKRQRKRHPMVFHSDRTSVSGIRQ